MHTLNLCLSVSNRQEKAPDYCVWNTAYLFPKPKSMRKHFIAVNGHWVTKSEFTQPGTLSHWLQSRSEWILSRIFFRQGSCGPVLPSGPELLQHSCIAVPVTVWQCTEQPQGKDCKTALEWKTVLISRRIRGFLLRSYLTSNFFLLSLICRSQKQ